MEGWGLSPLVRYIFESYFDEFVSLHGDVDVSPLEGVTLKDLKLRHEKIKSGKEDAGTGLELRSGTIGSLRFQPMAALGKMQVVASEVVFDFDVEPMKAIGNAIQSSVNGPAASQPGYVRAAGESTGGSNWDALLGFGRCAQTQPEQRVRPLYCAPHYKVEHRKRGLDRRVECKRCGACLRTNYTMCKLCPACSRQWRQCVLCASPDVVQSTKDLAEDRMVELGNTRQTADNGLLCSSGVFLDGSDRENFTRMLQCIAEDSPKARRAGVASSPTSRDPRLVKRRQPLRPRMEDSPLEGQPMASMASASVLANQQAHFGSRQPRLLNASELGGVDGDCQDLVIEPKNGFKWSVIPPRTLTGDGGEDMSEFSLDNILSDRGEKSCGPLPVPSLTPQASFDGEDEGDEGSLLPCASPSLPHPSRMGALDGMRSGEASSADVATLRARILTLEAQVAALQKLKCSEQAFPQPGDRREQQGVPERRELV